MARRARRNRTAHRGVKLKEITYRSGATGWVARYRDPDTGKERQESLDQYGVTSEAARRQWATDKFDEIARRRGDLATGAAPHTGETVEDAIESYFDTKGARVKDSTKSTYRAAASRFLEWAVLANVRLADELHGRHLAAFVEWLAAQPAKAAVKGGRRKERAATDRTCSPGGVNNRLRSVKAILNHLRRLGRLPHITSDDIKDRLKPLKTPRPRPGFLRAAQIRSLLKAALRHDADTFEMTRDEHDGKGPRGVTQKYDPIAPFIAYMLLTGCRLEEALGLKWTAVEFEAKDHRGKKVGEIVLRASDVKTGHERAIDLGICPSLRRILLALKLKAGACPYVFGGVDALEAYKPWSRTKVEAARRRLTGKPAEDDEDNSERHTGYGAPAFCWSQTEGETPALRATCGSYLTNAPGIYGAAAAFHSAKRLGHSVQIAEKHYLGLIRGIPKRATTLDAAMEVTKELAEIVLAAGGVAGRTARPVRTPSRDAARRPVG